MFTDNHTDTPNDRTEINDNEFSQIRSSLSVYHPSSKIDREKIV